MSAWTWLTRLVLGAEKEAEEKAATDRFTETMNGNSEPPMSPDELEARLDAIVARVEYESATLSSVHPHEADDDKRRRQRETIPDPDERAVTGRFAGGGEEDAGRRDSSGGVG